MERVARSSSAQPSFVALLYLVMIFCMPSLTLAQTGYNAVWQNQSTKIGSPAFVDATAFTSKGDICQNINYILSNMPTSNEGLVIDARGVLPSVGNSQPCSINPLQNVSSLFSTILLPPGTITICTTWILPTVTKIIGEGPGQGGVIGTTLQVGSSSQCSGNSFSGTTMIQMGGTTNCTSSDCFSVSISDLALNGQDPQGNYTSIDGIDDSEAQELSLVQHVAMINIGKIGMSVGVANSGPYSDISIAVTSNATACVVIANGSPRGVHGLSCTCAQNGTACSNPKAGIYLGGSNTSIEDVYVNGFQDGIYVGLSGPGTTAPAPTNVLFNINGGSVTNLIHISNGLSTTSTCPPQNGNPISVNNVCDLTILGATSSTGNTILDDQNSTTLSNATDPTVGMYIIGEQVSGGSNNTSIGNSRFTTSPSVPTWVVGSTSPSGACSAGDLYSITTGTSGDTLWGCVLASPTNEWLPII
jgi:hypothetical protein